MLWQGARLQGLASAAMAITRQQRSSAETGMQPTKGCNLLLEMGQLRVRAQERQDLHDSKSSPDLAFCVCRVQPAACLRKLDGIHPWVSAQMLTWGHCCPSEITLCAWSWAEARQLGAISNILEERLRA